MAHGAALNNPCTHECHILSVICLYRNEEIITCNLTIENIEYYKHIPSQYFE